MTVFGYKNEPMSNFLTKLSDIESQMHTRVNQQCEVGRLIYRMA